MFAGERCLKALWFYPQPSNPISSIRGRHPHSSPIKLAMVNSATHPALRTRTYGRGPLFYMQGCQKHNRIGGTLYINPKPETLNRVAALY